MTICTGTLNTLEIATKDGVSLGEWNIKTIPTISCTTVACSQPSIKCFRMLDIFDIPHVVPEITRVIFKAPVTVVFWADGDKTVVKSDDVDGYYEHLGLASAIVKKAFGCRSRWASHVRKLQKRINELPMTECKFDEFDLMLHYMDKLYTEKKFSDMVEKHMRKNYRVTE